MDKAQLPINGIIQELGDGPFYEVELKWIPRAGELIKLYSSLDAASGHPPSHWYEVVQVLHEMHDVTDKAPNANMATKGHHFVAVFVKKSQDALFKK